MLKIGLTGGIGCGKSTVAELFAAKGIPILDADVIARELVEPNQPAFEAIKQHFGAAILKDGCLDRVRLREIVFFDPEEKRWLETLLHPLVYSEINRRLAILSAPYCILVVPLLLETGRRHLVDRLLVVDCPEDLQRQRVELRDGLSQPEIEKIMSSQLSRSERLAAADDVLENIGDKVSLSDQVEQLHQFYLALSRH
ncbi:dephospho-CoA kinase [Methylocaldum sp.]|uniref:dephospho-CoA kinase n=1 Tax=Methylocaldum sp. TaxID=1969727 RepID=UPI002D3246FE|nr:dephospho-CoA kinase [Methylocaldum sp.]HYE35008.1 dephospho-CoA kinase [Methylocaldum sp.]